MSLDMRIKPGRDYLTVVVSGAFELYQANDLTPRILDACAEHRASRLLFDARTVSGTMSITERFIYADTFATLYKARRVAGTVKHIQIACVGTPELVDPQRFGEKVMKMRGMHVKVMTALDEALAWLGIKPLPEEYPAPPAISRGARRKP